MNQAPITPFASPIPFAIDTIDLTLVVQVALYAVIVYWIIYTLIAVYHWFNYSHNAAIAVPAVAVHAFVSLVLIGYVIVGLV